MLPRCKPQWKSAPVHLEEHLWGIQWFHQSGQQHHVSAPFLQKTRRPWRQRGEVCGEQITQTFWGIAPVCLWLVWNSEVEITGTRHVSPPQSLIWTCPFHLPQVTPHDINTIKTDYSVDDQIFVPDTEYAARVRSSPNQDFYKGQWSNWSPEVHWKTQPAIDGQFSIANPQSVKCIVTWELTFLLHYKLPTF